MNTYNIDSNVDSFNNRILTVTRPGGKNIKVMANILYTLPMIHVTSDVLDLRMVDSVTNRESDIVTIKRYTKELAANDLVKDATGVTYRENGNWVVNESGNYINSVADKERFKVLQIAKGVASNKEAMVLFDKKYKDIIVIPNLEYVNCETWVGFDVTYVKGHRIGSYSTLGDELVRTEYNLPMNEDEAVEIQEPEAVVSETLLIDAYGLNNGDAGNHYSDYVYYEKTQNHNGVPVNYGITRCQTQPIGLVCLGTIGELYPTGLLSPLPLYGITQPFIRNYGLTELGKVIPKPTDKIYFLLDI